MARFTYNTSTPMGQLVSEGIDDLQNALANITRSSEAITLMSAEQMSAEVGVPDSEQAGFRSGLNQLRTALEDDPFSKLLPTYDQG